VPDDSIGWGDLLSLGAVVAVLIVIGLGLGLLVDHVAGTSPVFLLVGLLLGIVGAVAYAVRRFRKFLKT
jgi:F0F1-type ATP synthase assembly protein I